jgi:polyvinyl alcohol dehydrogenase (cytochrome)
MPLTKRIRPTLLSRPIPRLLVAGLAALSLVGSALLAVPGTAAGDESGSVSASAAAGWPTWQKDIIGTRFAAAERRITPATAPNLTLKWAFTFDDVPFARIGSQPAVVGGVLYVGGPDGKLFALDAKSGATKWVFDTAPIAGPSTDQSPNQLRDGPAVAGGKVYFGDARGFVYAVSISDGRLAWATEVDPHPSTWLTSSPLVFGGRVYIGVSSIEAGFAMNQQYPCCTFRGQVAALDADTGAVDWRYYTVPPAQEAGTWPSGVTKYAPSGGGVWSSPVIDPVRRTVYIGTGQNYTGAAGDIDSLLALNADTGAARWKQQITFPDTYTQQCTQPNAGEWCPSQADGTAKDFDVGSTPNLFQAGGRALVGVGAKSGAYQVFDAATGSPVWKTQLAEPDLSDPDPGGAGIEWGTSYDGRRIYAATWRANPATLNALDPATGRILWRTPHPANGCSTGGAAAYPELCWPAFTPAVTTSPGLVYEGSADGKMRVFSADRGNVLWEFDTVQDFDGVNGLPGRGRAVSGNGGAVVVDGMLYVQSGYYPFYPSDRGTVLLAFSL